MLVSIIVPVYNMEKYLVRCLDSLVNQSLSDFEVICINDASTDDSLMILNEYKNKYPDLVSVIDSKINLKQGGARNLGLKIAQGEYVGFIDSDDWAELSMFETLYSKIDKSPFSIAYCNYNVRYTDKSIDRVEDRTKSISWELDSIVEIKNKLLSSPSSIWTGLYSRDFFDIKNLRFPEELFYEDNYLVPLLILNAKSIKKVNEGLVNYFQGNISVTRSFNNERYFDRLICSKLLLEDFRKDSFPELKESMEFFFIETFFINTSVGCYLKFDPIRPEKVKLIKKELEFLIPNYKENKYLNEKISRNLKYKVFTIFLFDYKWILDFSFSLRSKFLKGIRKW